MSPQRALQSAPAPAEQSHRRAYRIYTVSQLVGPDLLNMSRRTFFRLRGLGQLPFLAEVQPRAGRVIRYRADLVDRYLAGQWQQPRSFAHGRQSRSGSTSTVSPQKRQFATEHRS